MLFSSIPFLYYFLPVTILIYLIAPVRIKNTVLLFASLFFYAWGERKLVLLFAITITLAWLFGLAIEKTRGNKYSKLLLILSIVVNLCILCYFKYLNFFITNLNNAFGLSIAVLKIALPIGISFYIFQIISYTVDVYNGDAHAQRNIIKFATYISLFPQLIAGPIVRYSAISGQLNSRPSTIDGIAAGLRRFVIGLGKKVIIANSLGELCTIFRNSSDSSILFYWIYAISFTLQVYFDFSGYSDMAIGMGKIFGFDFPENFNYPYISTSITEFWRRWHISLGSWFRDYVYIPLGGNRHGMLRQLFNIFIVWSLTGLWHGAAWNFIIWGLFYAVLLAIEKIGFKRFLQQHLVLGHFDVMFMVIIGFVIFNAASLTELGRDLSCLFGLDRLPAVSSQALYYLKSYAIILVIAVIGSTPLPKKLVLLAKKKSCLSFIIDIIEPILLAGIFLIVSAYLIDGSFNPFLYFRF